MQQLLPSLRDTPIAFAHRGARAHAPENTLEAFLLALKLGANGLESDAWITSDNVIVLDHDGVVRRWGKKSAIKDVRAAQLPSHIPTLSEVYERCGTNFDFSIDVKDVDAFQGVVEDSRGSNFDLSRLWLCHYKLSVTLESRKKFDDVKIVDSSRFARIKEGIERRCATLSEAGVDALNMHVSDWSGGWTTLTHKFGLFAFAWDIQQEHLLDNSLRMGLDGLYSDHVDKLVDAYARYVGHPPQK